MELDDVIQTEGGDQLLQESGDGLHLESAEAGGGAVGTWDDLQDVGRFTAWWNGDANLDTTGDANDIVGDYNGMWVTPAAYADPPAGKGLGRAFSFSGSTNITTTMPSITGSFGVSLWFKHTQTSLKVAFGTNAGSSWYIGSLNGNVYAATAAAGGAIISSGTYNDDAWHHVVLTGDGTTVTAYVDGSVIGTKSQITHPPSGGNPSIGALGPSANRWIGSLFDVRVYGEHLDATEVAALYAGPEPTNTVAPVASQTGYLLSTTTGTWDSYSNGSLTYTYQWQSYSGSWSNVSGATSSTYAAVTAGTYRCNVTASNNGGAGDAASSNSVDADATSYHSVIAAAERHVPMQETGAITSITGGTIEGGRNASNLTTTGPGGAWPLAFDFNGTSDRIDVSDTLTGAFSISFIAYLDSADATGATLFRATNSNNGLQIFRSGTTLFWDNGGFTAPNRVSASVASYDDQWTRFTFVTSGAAGSTHKIYAGETELASSALSFDADYIVAKFGSQVNGSTLFNGKAAAVGIWNALLSPAEIAELNAGPEPTNTVAPTFDAATGDWDVGTWDSYSNGSLTYTVLLKDDADDSTVATLQTDDPTTSGNCLSDLATAGAGTYYIEVVAANDGGMALEEITDSATSEYDDTPIMSYTPYTRHKLTNVAQRLRGSQGCRMVMLGDSTAAPGNTPRWSQSIIKGWRLPIIGRTCYEHSTGAAAEGLEIYNAPTLSTAPGGTIDGVTVPPGWTAFYRQLAAETGGINMYRPIISSLDNYALGHPLAGSNVELTVAVLGTPNAMQRAGGSYTGAVTHSYGVGLMGLVSGQWNKVSRGITTNTIGTGATIQALWDTPFGEEVILNKFFTIGGCEWTCPARVGTTGLIYSSIAIGGYSVYDHLPTALGGPGNYSDAERAAKFDFWGWPEVITIMLGFNLEADELVSGELQAIWKTRYEALIEWHRDLYAANDQPAPLFMLINGWDTTGASSYREQQAAVLYEIADAATDVGVLNLMQIMRDEYGDFDDWQATYLSDGIHQSTAGAEEFGELSWRELEYATATAPGPLDLSKPVHRSTWRPIWRN